MVNRIPGGLGGPGGGSGPPNPYPDPRGLGGQALPRGGPQVVLHYLGGKLGKFMVTPGTGAREYFFSKGMPDVSMSFVEARAIVGQSPSEFTIQPVPQAAPTSAQPRQRTTPSVQQSMAGPMTRIPFAAAKEGLKAHRPECTFYPRFPDWTFEGIEEILAAGFELCGHRNCFKDEIARSKEGAET